MHRLELPEPRGEYGTENIFEELSGRKFQTFAELEAKVVEKFDEHLFSFSPSYTPDRALELGAHYGWIRRTGDASRPFQIVYQPLTDIEQP